MKRSGTASDAHAQAFLDDALDRVLRAWADGREVSIDELAVGRVDLRGELEELIATARETAIVRPQTLPQITGYEILHEVGRGGMGIVFSARQQGLNRLVALKVLPEFVAGSERSRRRFLAEAKSLARVRHPHVVTILDVFEAGSSCAYAMEWIDGKSLADLLHELRGRRRGEPGQEVSFGGPGSQRLPLDAVVWFCRLGIAIARALAEVHRGGLVHRDVKPSNILLRSDGTPLLSDFGLVRDDSMSLTGSGQIVGTLAFAPPEQLRGDNDRVGPQSDLFALGVTLYLSVAGIAPFAGQTPVELCANIDSRARLPLTKLGLSRDLETIIGKCLEPRMEDRYASADAVADDLESLLALRPIAARPLGVLPRLWRLLRRNRRTVMATAFIGIVMLVASVAWAWHLSHQLSAPTKFATHLRAARGALLEEFHGHRVALATRGAIQPENRALLGIQRALKSYDSALASMPDQAVAREREVVASANTTLIRMTPALPEDDSATVAQRHPLPVHLASDNRLRGLYAFLLGDVTACHEAWGDIDLSPDPASADPLVDAAAGQMHLVQGASGKAYPRLLRAFAAWPDKGFLAVAVADAALREGDLTVAEKYLRVAERVAYVHPSKTWVQAQLFAAQGRVAQARASYEEVPWHPDLAMQEHARLCFAQLLEQQGEREKALMLVLELVERWPDRTRHGQRLTQLAESWWAGLPMPSKQTEVLRCWNTSDSSPLLRRLASVRRRLVEESPETTTAAQPRTSSEVTRQTWSMSTLPLEFTMTQSRVQGWVRRVPLTVQRLAAAVLLSKEVSSGPRMVQAMSKVSVR